MMDIRTTDICKWCNRVYDTARGHCEWFCTAACAEAYWQARACGDGPPHSDELGS